MYEPFTDRARKAMLLANREAERFNHGYLGTEHLLLGLLEAGRSVAICALENLGVDLRQLRFDIERLLSIDPPPATAGAKLPQTQRTRRVIEHAIEESRNLKLGDIGTEHLLLGLLHVPEGIAATVLMMQNVRLQTAREQIVRVLGGGIRSGPMPAPEPREIEDLPAELQTIAAELDAEIERLTAAKLKAIANGEFQTAACLSDDEDQRLHKRSNLLSAWITDRLAEPAWLSANDGAVLKLAQTINEQQDWAALPHLADALEQAGCTDGDLIGHCRQAGEHSHQCWVIDLLLASA
jgi:ATP-dependent Clp protease ATP-binding subunit ClpA